MITSIQAPAATDRDLMLTRLIPAARERVYAAWTDPPLLMQWFAPKPWTTPIAEMDVRVGGSSHIVMRSPDGHEFANRGIYLEVVPHERLIFTDAFSAGWVPSKKPFMTVFLTFEQEQGMTKYTALVRHWTVADREAHENRGFHKGWGLCADQMAELLAKP